MAPQRARHVAGRSGDALASRLPQGALTADARSELDVEHRPVGADARPAGLRRLRAGSERFARLPWAWRRLRVPLGRPRGRFGSLRCCRPRPGSREAWPPHVEFGGRVGKATGRRVAAYGFVYQLEAAAEQRDGVDRHVRTRRVVEHRWASRPRRRSVAGRAVRRGRRSPGRPSS